MKVMIVSFDKALAESLKEVLSEHEVYVAKNSEEALKMIPPEIEVVIYDAISGAISEEDINTLYTKKFSNARYMILYDELFPVDSKNIVATFKKFVPRDTPPEEMVQRMLELTREVAPSEEPAVEQTVQTEGEEKPEVQEPSPEESLIEHTSLVPETTGDVQPPPPEGELEIEPTEIPSVEDIGQAQEEIEIEPTAIEVPEVAEEPPQEEVAQAPPEPEEAVPEVAPPEPATTADRSANKVLLISFDQTLLDSLKGVLGRDYEILNVKTVKHALEKGKDSKVVVFDAISGVIAEKGLIDLSNDPVMKNKPYLILVDDLFPINVDSVPLEKKESLSRDSDPQRIREIIVSMAEQAEEEAQVAEEVEELTPQEAPPQTQEEPVEEVAGVQEEAGEVATEEPSEEIAQGEEPEEITAEAGVEDVEELVAELPGTEEVPAEEAQEEEEEIPALEALGRLIEEQKEERAEEVQQAPEEAPKELVEEPTPPAIGEEQIREAILSAVDQKLSELGDAITNAVREKVEEALESADIQKIIKEVAYQVLKERLEEIVS